MQAFVSIFNLILISYLFVIYTRDDTWHEASLGELMNQGNVLKTKLQLNIGRAITKCSWICRQKCSTIKHIASLHKSVVNWISRRWREVWLPPCSATCQSSGSNIFGQLCLSGCQPYPASCPPKCRWTEKEWPPSHTLDPLSPRHQSLSDTLGTNLVFPIYGTNIPSVLGLVFLDLSTVQLFFSLPPDPPLPVLSVP